jgi:hypothetical protein
MMLQPALAKAHLNLVETQGELHDKQDSNSFSKSGSCCFRWAGQVH